MAPRKVNPNAKNSSKIADDKSKLSNKAGKNAKPVADTKAKTAAKTKPMPALKKANEAPAPQKQQKQVPAKGPAKKHVELDSKLNEVSSSSSDSDHSSDESGSDNENDNNNANNNNNKNTKMKVVVKNIPEKTASSRFVTAPSLVTLVASGVVGAAAYFARLGAPIAAGAAAGTFVIIEAFKKVRSLIAERHYNTAIAEGIITEGAKGANDHAHVNKKKHPEFNTAFYELGLAAQASWFEYAKQTVTAPRTFVPTFISSASTAYQIGRKDAEKTLQKVAEITDVQKTQENSDNKPRTRSQTKSCCK